jgi:oleate hydratase
MIRDGSLPGENISILEAAPIMGGNLDGAGDPAAGYSMRGGRMLTTGNYECTWDLYKSIPSLNNEGKTVFDETVEFNERHKSNAMARLVDSRRAPVTSMGFSMEDRIELLKLSHAGEDALAASCITDWLSPGFFETEFWYMWSTTFAFQPSHSAVEFRRYLHRFLPEFSRIETIAGVKRTIYNQYDSLVLPLQTWLAAQGVRLVADCKVTDLDHKTEDGKFIVTGIRCLRRDKSEVIAVNDGDFVFLQNGSMTDASSLGSMTSAPRKLTKAESGGWALWEKLAGQPEFGNPAAFNSCIAQSCWESFTVTLKNPAFFDRMTQFSGNQPGAGGLVTFKDSNWLMSIVLAHQPHFPNQPAGVQGVLGILAVSGPGRQFRSAADGRVPWRGNSAVTCDSIRRPLHRPTAFLAECLTSPACSCPACATIDRCRCLAARGISHSSASSSKFRMMSSLRWSTRCERPRWPSTSCSISTAKSRP